eukprot:5593219-Amphidinium_carterae.1
MSKFQCSSVPVIAEQGFRFPSKSSQSLALRCEAAGVESDGIADVLATLFKEIAIEFHAQHSGQTLLNLGLRSSKPPKPQIILNGEKVGNNW